jgi:ribose transport system ATP-binding protein
MNATDRQPVLSVSAVTRDFGAVRALEGVSLDFLPGEVHGLVGENGAGKSTLMRILAGVDQPTGGRVLHRGRPARLSSPADANRLGITMVHQELNLVDELSAADNIFLGREPMRLGLMDRASMESRAGELLRRVGSDVSPRDKVGRLSVARRQMVEIAKALSFDARVLILDEPTAVLARRDVRRLLDLVRRLRNEGVTVVYISHLLDEVIALCDRISVLRDGKLVRTLASADGLTEGALASMMVGRQMADHFPPRPAVSSEVVLSVRNLRAGRWAQDVSFDVRRGEILGLAGLVGAGRTETAEALMGLRRRDGGQVRLLGRPIRPAHPRDAVDAGMAYLSEDRRGRGLVIGRPIRENLTLAALRNYTRGLIWPGRERTAAAELIARLGIKVGSMDDDIRTLSGGNQQKVALAKWLPCRPAALLLDEPTRGVDIGAKEELYRLIRDLASGGLACVMISSELNELLGMAHRIAVMRAGRVSAVLEGSEMTEENVMLAAAGVSQEVAP